MAPSSARLSILAASVLWSTSGAFAKYLNLPAATMAMNRTLVAALFLGALCVAARKKPSFHPVMILMMICFATMNYTFVASMTLTSSANSIFLQYTAPLWMAVGSAWLLGESVDRRTAWAIAGCLLGVVIIVAGNLSSSGAEIWGMGLGLSAGLFYAGVALSLRFLRNHDPRWLAFLNHAGAGLSLLTIYGIGWMIGQNNGEVFAWPTDPVKGIALLAFGVVQMGFPYILFARGLSGVSAQEAGILTLIEPILNPIWAYLVAGDIPTTPTLAGGVVLLAALATRYLPTSSVSARP